MTGMTSNSFAGKYMTRKQATLFQRVRRPSTRYQGSKLKLANWIMDVTRDLEFATCLDAFGGSGIISHAFKALGKSVTYNDIQPFNAHVGKAIIENNAVRLNNAKDLLKRSGRYSSFITETFSNVYFTDEENAWLDVVTQNIFKIRDATEQSLAFYALFQSCIVKRPYNLFHRANLYMRTQDVERSFGNKTTWDRPFEDHFLNFVDEVNECVFDSDTPCYATCQDAAKIAGDFDLVYIDSPYINGSGVGLNYGDFYHFLNGLVDYPNWKNRIDTTRKHLPLIREDDPWSDKRRISEAFNQLFQRHQDSIIVVSYRSDGIPSEEELVEILSRYKRVERHYHGKYKYALSTNSKSKELLLVGR